MRLEKLLLISSVLLSVFSCTTEDLIPNTDEAKPNEAYLSFQVNAGSTQTKAGSSSTDNATRTDKISDCSLIVFRKDNSVYRAYDGLKVIDGRIQLATTGTDPFLVQVKLNKGETNKVFKLVVVGNTVQKYAACTNYDGLQAKLLNETDLNHHVKVSDLIEVVIPKGFPTIDEASQTANIVNREIELRQIASRVELTDFNVTFKNGTRPVDVTIKDIMLVNRNTQSITKVDDVTSLSLDNAVWKDAGGQSISLPVVDTKTTGNNFADVADKPFFNTFANFSPVMGKETALRFTLAYKSADGTDEKTFEFVINRPTEAGDFTNNSGHTYVRSGYIYQVKVNASLTSSIECSIQCYTKDWNYNQISYAY